eukprot:3141055-Rhodomonas_salina.1
MCPLTLLPCSRFEPPLIPPPPSSFLLFLLLLPPLPPPPSSSSSSSSLFLPPLPPPPPQVSFLQRGPSSQLQPKEAFWGGAGSDSDDDDKVPTGYLQGTYRGTYRVFAGDLQGTYRVFAGYLGNQGYLAGTSAYIRDPWACYTPKSNTRKRIFSTICTRNARPSTKRSTIIRPSPSPGQANAHLYKCPRMLRRMPCAQAQCGTSGTERAYGAVRVVLSSRM